MRSIFSIRSSQHLVRGVARRRLLPCICISMLSHPASYPPINRVYQGSHISMYCNAVSGHEETASTSSRARIKWTQEKKDELHALWKEGKSPKEIARVMGCSEDAVHIAWHKFFSKVLGSWDGKQVWTQERKDQLLALRNERKSQKEASEVLGYSRMAVNRAWHKFFIKDHGSWGDDEVWTQERKDQLLALRNERKSQKEASEVLGYSRMAVNRAWHRFFIKDHGSCNWDGRVKSDVLIDNELLEELFDLRNEGRCQAEAAYILEITVKRLRDVLRYHFQKGHGSWDGSELRVIWTQELQDHLLSLRYEGKTEDEAATIMGSNRGKISYAWSRYHGKERGPWYDQSFWTQERKDQLLALWKEGKSQREAAEVLGCSGRAIVFAWGEFCSEVYGSWRREKASRGI